PAGSVTRGSRSRSRSSAVRSMKRRSFASPAPTSAPPTGTPAAPTPRSGSHSGAKPPPRLGRQAQAQPQLEQLLRGERGVGNPGHRPAVMTVNEGRLAHDESAAALDALVGGLVEEFP